jgi:hypothetical protein
MGVFWDSYGIDGIYIGKPWKNGDFTKKVKDEDSHEIYRVDLMIAKLTYYLINVWVYG